MGLSRHALKWVDGSRTARRTRLQEVCGWAHLEFAASNPFKDTAGLPFRPFRFRRNLVENVIWDPSRSTRFRVFDYWFMDPGNDHVVQRPRRLTCAIAPLPTIAPRLRVAPRKGSNAKDSIGLPEVELNPEEFNKRFLVETEDVRFAIGLLQRGMLDALAALPDGVALNANQDVMMLSAPLLPPQQVVLLFDAVVAIATRVPAGIISTHKVHLEPSLGTWTPIGSAPAPAGEIA
jgi:hypothetical protein